MIIREEDCGTTDGIEIGAIIASGKPIESLAERLVGRFALPI